LKEPPRALARLVVPNAGSAAKRPCPHVVPGYGAHRPHARSWAPVRAISPAVVSARRSALRDRQVPDASLGAPDPGYRPGMLAQSANKIS